MIRLENRKLFYIVLGLIIPSLIISSYAVTELSVSRDSYSEDNYLLFEDHNGVDQFWIDGDGYAYANGTLLGAGGGGGAFTVVYKTADETISNDNTLTDDTDLQWSVDANSFYTGECMILFQSSTNADWKHAFSVPSGTTILVPQSFPSWSNERLWDSGTVAESEALSTTQDNFIGTYFIINVGGTAGTVAYQWAQDTSHADTTKVEEGSYCYYTKHD